MTRQDVLKKLKSIQPLEKTVKATENKISVYIKSYGSGGKTLLKINHLKEMEAERKKYNDLLESTKAEIEAMSVNLTTQEVLIIKDRFYFGKTNKECMDIYSYSDSGIQTVITRAITKMVETANNS